MPGVGAEAVADVDHRPRPAGRQSAAGGQPRGRLELAATQARGDRRGQAGVGDLGVGEQQARRRGAQLAGQHQRVAWPGAVAVDEEAWRGRMTYHRAREGEDRAARDVAAGERRAGRRGELEHPVESLETAVLVEVGRAP